MEGACKGCLRAVVLVVTQDLTQVGVIIVFAYYVPAGDFDTLIQSLFGRLPLTSANPCAAQRAHWITQFYRRAIPDLCVPALLVGQRPQSSQHNYRSKTYTATDSQ